MERVLIEFILETDVLISNYLKTISNNRFHITIKSLYNILLPFSSLPKTKNNNDNQNNNNDQLVYGLKKQELSILNSLIFSFLYKNNGTDTKDNDFVYSFRDPIFNINHIINNVDKRLVNCLDILRNNKRLLIKSPIPQLQSQSQSPSQSQQQSQSESQEQKEQDKINKNTIVFFKNWRNLVIKNKILDELRKFNNHFQMFTFKSILELDRYIFKDYLNHVQLILSDINNEDQMFINDYLENKLSSSVSILQIYDDYNKFIRPNSIPSTIKYLHFGTLYFTPNIKKIVLNIPLTGDSSIYNNFLINDNKNKIKLIRFLEFNSKIYNGSIPNSVESIEFLWFNSEKNKKYNHLLKSLPNSIKSLTLEYEWDFLEKPHPIQGEVINYLPPQLNMFLHNCLNSIDSRVLKTSLLTKLVICNCEVAFNYQEIEKGILPQPLKELTLGNYFFKLRKGTLPKNLTHLTLSYLYVKTIKPTVLPNSLLYLSFEYDQFNGHMSGDFGYVEFQLHLSHLYKQMKRQHKASNSFKFNKPCIVKGTLPISLTTLKLSYVQLYLDILVKDVLTESHKSLRKITIHPNLKLDYKFGYIDDIKDLDKRILKWENNKFIPKNVETITVKTNLYNLDLLKNFHYATKFKIFNYTKQSSFKDLVFPPFVHSIETPTVPTGDQLLRFPNSLTSLKISRTFRYPLKVSQFPNSLQHLVFNNWEPFRGRKLKIKKLPKNLKFLVLPDYFNSSLVIDDCLPNLEVLVIGDSNPSLIFTDESLSLPHLKLKYIVIFNTNLKFLNNKNNNHILIQSILKIINPYQLKYILKAFKSGML
ncbi:hypothetical protein ACTFIV_001430 [Dictyostelium citrinum]